MALTAVRRAGWWRWLVVAVGVAVLLTLPFVVAALPAHRSALSTNELLARIRASGNQPYQGFALGSGTAGLPSIPQLADVIALLDGQTQLRAYYRGPQSWRVDQIGIGTERDIYQLPDRVAIWDSGSGNRLDFVHLLSRLPRGADLLPPDLARRLVAAVTVYPKAPGPASNSPGPTKAPKATPAIGTPATVAALPARRIAGHDADGVRLTPIDQRTLIGVIDIWADPTTGLPLQVEISGRGARTPFLVTRFLDLSFDAPSAAVVTPPGQPDATSVNASVDATLRALGFGSLPTHLAGMARATDNTAAPVLPFSQPDRPQAFGVYGTGLTQFLVIPVPRDIGRDTFDRFESSGGLALALPNDGRGIQLSTPFLTVMVVEAIAWDSLRVYAGSTVQFGHPESYILVGLVSGDLLRAAAEGLSAMPKATK